MVNVFVSRPTRIGVEFKDGLDAFLDILRTLGITPRTLGATDYPTKAPLDEVLQLLDECSGMIVIGYPQVVVTAGTLRGEPVSGLVLGTEWHHIEAALAYARGMPLLVVHHTGVTRGIFDRGTLNSFVYAADLSNTGWPLRPEIQGGLRAWHGQLGPVPSTGSTPRTNGEPICPNCSRPGAAFVMSPIPREFVRIEGASHECTKCGYKKPTAAT